MAGRVNPLDRLPFPPQATLRALLQDVVSLQGRAWSDVERYMTQLRLSPGLLDRRADQVSGGELQRLALVRVLLLEPVLVFADEPTSRLDAITQQVTLERLLEATVAQDRALLLVTHDPHIAQRLGARVLELG